jgi:hypothetical protein
MSEMGGDTPVESGESGSGASAESGIEADESADNQNESGNQSDQGSRETPRPVGLPPDVDVPSIPGKEVPYNPGDPTPAPNTPNVLPKPDSSPSREITPG